MGAQKLYQQLIGNKYGEKDKFFGEYEAINDIPEDLSDVALFNYQISRVQAYEDAVLSSINIPELNQLLSLSNIEKSINSLKEEEAKAIQEMSVNFLKIANQALKSGSPVWSTGKEQKEERLALIEQLKADINNLNAQIAEQTGEGLSPRFLQLFFNRFTKSGYLSGSKEQKLYAQEKGEALEQLATNFLRKYLDQIGLKSGNLLQHGQQIIEDILISIGDQTIQLSPELQAQLKIKTNTTTSQDLLKKIEELQFEENFQISDELYDLLQDTRYFIAVQAKSGIDQDILTRAARNSLTLEQINFQPLLLYDLFVQHKNAFSNYSGDELTALANYNLSKSIDRTMLSKNLIYITEKGFTTASTWMKLRNRFIKFSGSIVLNDVFLNEIRSYKFYPVVGA